MNGTLLIAGGNLSEDLSQSQNIFKHFVSLCGGRQGKILLIVCAGGDCPDSWNYYSEIFKEAGIGETVLLPLTEDKRLLKTGCWTDEADEKLLPLFQGITGIWFTGGDQLRTVRLLLKSGQEDTPVLTRIRQHLNEGGVIGGTSAGAAIMSRTMIVRGDDAGTLTLPVCTELSDYPDPDAENTPEQLLLLKGLGFLPLGIADQHFNRRPRLQRLLAAMETAGESLGLGISEDTALEVDLKQNTFRVLGSAYIMRAVSENGSIIIHKFTAADPAVQYRSKIQEEIL